MRHGEQWFVPECRELVYRPGPEKKRLAIVVGHCAYCGGDLSAGVTAPNGRDQDKLFNFLCLWFRKFQPYRQKYDRLGRPAATAEEREQWYLHEDMQSTPERKAAFLALFTDGDERQAVELWLESPQGKEAMA